MPPQQKIDYAKLAEQARKETAGTDYDRMAREASTVDNVSFEAPPKKPLTRTEQFIQNHQGKVTPQPFKEFVGQVADALPVAGGAAGGIIGGAGGAVSTIPALGAGGVPGAIGGATIGAAGGEGARQVINYMIGRPSPTTATEAANRMLKEGLISGASEGVGRAATAGAAKLGEAFMQQAVKPAYQAVSRDIKNAEMPRVVKTLLNEGVNVTKGGIAKLNRALNATNDEIKLAIASANGTIDPANATRHLPEVQRVFRNQTTPRADMAAISGVEDEFLHHPDFYDPVTGRWNISPQKAQELKTGEYRQLQDKAYTGELKGSEVEARKAIARGLKEDIEAEVSKQGIDIRSLNMREADIIKAKDVVAKRVAAAGNRDAAGLAWIADHPVAALGFLMDRSPMVKSLVARGLYQSAAKAARVPENVIRLAVHSLATSPDSKEPQ